MGADELIALALAYGYWILFGAVLLDSFGLPVAGEILLVAVGVGVKTGTLDFVTTLAVAVPAAVTGHCAGYWTGRLAGRGWRTLAQRAAPGPIGVLFSRFLVGVRVVLAPLAGVARMPFRTFVLLDSAGAALWVSTFVLIGYAAGPSVDLVHATLAAGRAWVPVIIVAMAGATVTARAMAARRSSRA